MLLTLLTLLVLARFTAALVAFLAALLALTRVRMWALGRGVTHVRRLLLGLAFYHLISLAVPALQLIGVGALNPSLGMHAAWLVGQVVLAAVATEFALYLLGVVNGDHVPPPTCPEVPSPA